MCLKRGLVIIKIVRLVGFPFSVILKSSPLENKCPKVVSFADLFVMVSCERVILVQISRKDSDCSFIQFLYIHL